MTLQGLLHRHTYYVQCLVCVCVCVCVCRVVNGVFEKLGPHLLARNLQIVTEWLTGAGEVLDMMGQEAILKLFKLA